MKRSRLTNSSTTSSPSETDVKPVAKRSRGSGRFEHRIMSMNDKYELFIKICYMLF